MDKHNNPLWDSRNNGLREYRRDKVMNKKFNKVMEMTNQIEMCKFTDDIGHPIELNVGYIELKELALKQEKAINELESKLSDNTYYGIAIAAREFRNALGV